MKEKAYLGDGVYIHAEYGGVMLTTEDGIQVTNSIFLEPEVYAALLEYVRSRSSAKGAKP
jgi:hypothetical protein